MNIIVSILYGIIGAVIGYNVPSISLKIIEYKKRKEDTNKENFLYSKILKFCLCLFSGLAWGIVYYSINSAAITLLISIQITLGLIITYIDIKIRIIPNELVLTMAIMGIVFQTIYFGPKELGGAFVSMIVMIAIFTSVAGFVGLGKVGAGDIKLAGAMGLALGYPSIITAVSIMAIVMLTFILIGMVLKKIYLSTMLPMAPFMISGYIMSLIILFI